MISVVLRQALKGKIVADGVSKDGLVSGNAVGFRATAWALIAMTVRNEGNQPWTPTEARLVDAGTGRPVRVLGIRMKVPRIAPGEAAQVAIETGLPTWRAGTLFHLELQDVTGRRLLIRGVEL